MHKRGYLKLLFITLMVLESCNTTPKIKNDNLVKINETIHQGFKLQDSGFTDSTISIFNALIIQKPSSATLGICYNSLGNCYEDKQDYPTALENFLNAGVYFNQINDSISLARSQINTARCFQYIGIYHQTVNYGLKAEKILYKLEKYKLELSIIYNILGNAHKELGNLNLAKKYYLKVRKINSNFLPPLNSLGNLFFKQGLYKKALEYYRIYGDSARIQQNQTRYGISLENRAKTYLHLNDNIKGKFLLDSAHAIYKQIKDKIGIQSIHQLKSIYYFNLNNLKSSKQEIELALKLAKELNLQGGELEALQRMEMIYSRQGNNKEALSYLKKYHELKDTLEGVIQIRKVFTHELVTRSKKKEEEINELKRKNELIEVKRKKRAWERNALLLLGLLLGYISYYQYKRYKEKERFLNEYFSSDRGIILKSGEMLLYEDILKIEKLRNNLIITKVDRDSIVEKDTTLKSFIPNLPKIQFARPQRGIVVNLKMITKVWKTKLDLLDESINLSSKYSDDFLQSWSYFQQLKK